MTKRKTIGNKLRFETFKRDDFTCQYCGKHPPEVILNVDHIMPVALGGGNAQYNLITSCFNCNMGKGAKPLNSVPQSLKEKAKEISEREAQIKGYYEAIQSRHYRLECEKWQIMEALQGKKLKTANRSELASIKTFQVKLDLPLLLEAADITVSKFNYHSSKSFKYFCGICWNMIKDREA